MRARHGRGLHPAHSSSKLAVLIENPDVPAELEQLEQQVTVTIKRMQEEETLRRRDEQKMMNENHETLQVEFMQIEEMIKHMEHLMKQANQVSDEATDYGSAADEESWEAEHQDPSRPGEEAEEQDQSGPDEEIEEQASVQAQFLLRAFERDLAEHLIDVSPDLLGLFRDPLDDPVPGLRNVLGTFASILTKGMMLSQEDRQSILDSLGSSLDAWNAHWHEPNRSRRMGIASRLQAKSGRPRGRQYIRAGLHGG